MLAAGAAALLAGCADSTRLADPFSNPFGSSAKATYDPSPTGAIKERSAAPKTTRIESTPLAAPTSAPSPAPVAPQPEPGRVAGATSGNWTAEGGASIVVGQGETASMLAHRYGVPADALVKTNGFSSASQIQPGARIVVPVYRAGAGRTAEARQQPNIQPKSEPKPASRVAEKQPGAKKENLRFVKGPDAANAPKKADKAEKTEKSVAPKEAKKDGKVEAEKSKAAKAEADKAKLAKADADRKAKADAEKERQRVAEAKRQEKKQAAEARSEPKPAETKKVAEAKKPEVDTTPTASLPPAEKSESKSDSANPEFRWPARGRIIQGFKAGGNDGINIAVPEGTAVKAAEGGVVAYAGSELKGYGNLVLIRHPNGFVSAYAHNGSLDVKRGDQVKRGQTIAKAGQTGNVSTPQVHFELRKGSSPVDPTNYLAGL